MICVFRCPGCGSRMRFSIEDQMLFCDSCQTKMSPDEYDMDALTYEGNANVQGLENDIANDIEEYECPSCGSKVITSGEKASMKCSYCGEPLIAFAGKKDELMPEMILPFTVPESMVLYNMNKWWKEHPTLPKLDPKKLKMEMEPMYVPVWVAKVETTSNIQAQHSYVEIIGREKAGRLDPEHTRKVQHNNLIGKKIVSTFNLVPADGSARIADNIFLGIEPFDYGVMQPFNPAFLSGIKAERYYFDQNNVMPRILARTNKFGEQLCLDYLKADYPEGEDYNVVYKNIISTPKEVLYVMVPVWVCAYYYRGQRHLVYVNGQTGKADGDVAFAGSKLKRDVTMYGASNFMFWTGIAFATIASLFRGYVQIGIAVMFAAVGIQQLIDVGDDNPWRTLFRMLRPNTTSINADIQLRNGRRLGIGLCVIGNLISSFIAYGLGITAEQMPSVEEIQTMHFAKNRGQMALMDLGISVFVGILITIVVTALFRIRWKKYLSRQNLTQYYEYLSVSSTREIE